MKVQDPTPKWALLPGSRTFQRRCLAPRNSLKVIRQDWSIVPVTVRRGDALR